MKLLVKNVKEKIKMDSKYLKLIRNVGKKLVIITKNEYFYQMNNMTFTYTLYSIMNID